MELIHHHLFSSPRSLIPSGTICEMESNLSTAKRIRTCPRCATWSYTRKNHFTSVSSQQHVLPFLFQIDTFTTTAPRCTLPLHRICPLYKDNQQPEQTTVLLETLEQTLLKIVVPSLLGSNSTNDLANS